MYYRFIFVNFIFVVRAIYWDNFCNSTQNVYRLADCCCQNSDSNSFLQNEELNYELSNVCTSEKDTPFRFPDNTLFVKKEEGVSVLLSDDVDFFFRDKNFTWRIGGPAMTIRIKCSCTHGQDLDWYSLNANCVEVWKEDSP